MDERTKNKGGYVFQYYKPGQVVYNFTNSSKVWYFLPYSEHEKLMETIIIRSELDGLLEWPSRYVKQIILASFLLLLKYL